MSATDDLLAHLRERGHAVRTCGRGWSTRCPAHDDRAASLTINAGRKGAVLKCHAGCTTEAVCSAWDYPVRALFDEQREHKNGSAETRRTVYVIRDSDGVEVAQHIRTDGPGGKGFSWRRNGKGGLDGLPCADLPLFGTEHLRDLPDEPVVVVEGEKAATVLREIRGILALGTVTGASGTPGPAALAVLAGRDVTLWPDHDQIGRAHMHRIAAALANVAKSTRWVHPPADAPKGWDAADAGETLTDELLGEAGEVPPAEPEQPEQPEPATDRPASSPFASEALWTPPVRDWLVVQPDPQQWLLRRPTKDGQPCPPGRGDGFLRRGKVGTLSSTGGVGKTSAVAQLGVSIATGRRWFDYFEVDREPGRVMLALAENDVEDCHRYLHRIAEHLDIDTDERQAVHDRVVPMPLAGIDASLLRMVDGQPAPSENLLELRRQLDARGPWSLVVLDTQARLSGVDVESDNAFATKWVQAVETLCTVAGSPAVLVLAHSSKLAVRTGIADSRGVTGLTDSYRFAATLANDGNHVRLSCTKNNHGPKGADVLLVRGEYGLLRALTEEDAEDAEKAAADAEAAKLDALAERVPGVLRDRFGGWCDSRENIAKALGGKVAVGRLAVDIAVAKKLIVRTATTSRKSEYTLP